MPKQSEYNSYYDEEMTPEEISHRDKDENIFEAKYLEQIFKELNELNEGKEGKEGNSNLFKIPESKLKSTIDEVDFEKMNEEGRARCTETLRIIEEFESLFSYEDIIPEEVAINVQRIISGGEIQGKFIETIESEQSDIQIVEEKKRQRYKKYFLTYAHYPYQSMAQCEKTLEDFLNRKIRVKKKNEIKQNDIDSYIIAKEYHFDLSIHLHIYLCFQSAIDFPKQKSFWSLFENGLEICCGDIQRVKNKDNVQQYIKKGAEFVQFNISSEVGLKAANKYREKKGGEVLKALQDNNYELALFKRSQPGKVKAKGRQSRFFSNLVRFLLNQLYSEERSELFEKVWDEYMKAT